MDGVSDFVNHVYADKICIKLKYTDTPPDNPSAPTDNDPPPYNDIKEIEHSVRNACPDRKFSCRGRLIFTFTKSHNISRLRTYKSGRTRIFTYSTTFIVEIYI